MYVKYKVSYPGAGQFYTEVGAVAMKAQKEGISGTSSFHGLQLSFVQLYRILITQVEGIADQGVSDGYF